MTFLSPEPGDHIMQLFAPDGMVACVELKITLPPGANMMNFVSERLKVGIDDEGYIIVEIHDVQSLFAKSIDLDGPDGNE